MRSVIKNTLPTTPHESKKTTSMLCCRGLKITDTSPDYLNHDSDQTRVVDEPWGYLASKYRYHTALCLQKFDSLSQWISLHCHDILHIYIIFCSCQLSTGQNIYTSNIAGLNSLLLFNPLRVLAVLDQSSAGGHCPWVLLFKALCLAIDMQYSTLVFFLFTSTFFSIT